MDGRDGKSEDEIGQATIDFRVTEQEVYNIIDAMKIIFIPNIEKEKMISDLKSECSQTTNAFLYNIMKELGVYN